MPQPSGSPAEDTTRGGARSDAAGDGGAGSAGSEGRLYGLSLELLRDLLLQWHGLWCAVAEEAERLPPSVRQSLVELPTDPREGLDAACRAFASSVHPDVVAYLVTNLHAAAGTIDQLIEEQAGDPIGRSEDPSDLAARVHRLETVLSGLGAVMHGLGGPPS